MFFKRKKAFSAGAYDYIIAGLGNPGAKYEMTRHNAGFLAVDLLALNHGAEIKKLKFHALTGDLKLGGARCLLMKPQTYMNNSGQAVSEAARFYKIPAENIIVFSDDVLLDVGKIRIRRKGSAGGHNGLKSIINLLGSQDFQRVKIGVGKKPAPETDLIEWVLGRFPKEQEAQLKEALQNAAAAAELIAGGKTDEAMNLFN
ncbi:MAG: aminoacyl-tRNA hydrolase [Clostridiales bacterium]|nr:aminoacyl-tRNA hydrolase [Clostridiales bacterium]